MNISDISAVPPILSYRHYCKCEGWVDPQIPHIHSKFDTPVGTRTPPLQLAGLACYALHYGAKVRVETTEVPLYKQYNSSPLFNGNDRGATVTAAHQGLTGQGDSKFQHPENDVWDRHTPLPAAAVLLGRGLEPGLVSREYQ